MELLKAFPYRGMELGMRIRTEVASEMLVLQYGPGGVCGLRKSIEQLIGKVYVHS